MRISLREVSKKYEDNLLFSNVFIDFISGNVYFLSGESGCGKSTLASIIGLIEDPSSGEILIEDGSFLSLKGKEKIEFRRNNISFLFQDQNLIDELSVEDNLSFVSNDKGKIIELCKYFKVDSLLEKQAKKCSRGEKQRISLCRIFLEDKKVMIFDEPTANLDEENKVLFYNLIKKIQDKKIIIIIAHKDESKMTLLPFYCSYKLKNKSIKKENSFEKQEETSALGNIALNNSFCRRKMLKLSFSKNKFLTLFTSLLMIVSGLLLALSTTIIEKDSHSFFVNQVRKEDLSSIRYEGYLDDEKSFRKHSFLVKSPANSNIVPLYYSDSLDLFSSEDINVGYASTSFFTAFNINPGEEVDINGSKIKTYIKKGPKNFARKSNEPYILLSTNSFKKVFKNEVVLFNKDSLSDFTNYFISKGLAFQQFELSLDSFNENKKNNGIKIIFSNSMRMDIENKCDDIKSRIFVSNSSKGAGISIEKLYKDYFVENIEFKDDVFDATVKISLPTDKYDSIYENFFYFSPICDDSNSIYLDVNYKDIHRLLFNEKLKVEESLGHDFYIELSEYSFAYSVFAVIFALSIISLISSSLLFVLMFTRRLQNESTLLEAIGFNTDLIKILIFVVYFIFLSLPCLLSSFIAYKADLINMLPVLKDFSVIDIANSFPLLAFLITLGMVFIIGAFLIIEQGREKRKLASMLKINKEIDSE